MKESARDLRIPIEGKEGAETHLGVGSEGGEDGVVVRVLEINERSFEPLVLSSDARHVAERAAVDVVDADDVGVGPERLQHRRGRRGARGEREPVRAAGLEGGERGLEGVAVRVPGSGVFEALRAEPGEKPRPPCENGQRLPCASRRRPAYRLC